MAQTAPALDPDPMLSMYLRLWMQAQAAGACVTFCRRLAEHACGYFEPREQEGGAEPTIYVLREDYRPEDKVPTRNRRNGSLLTDAELRAELFTFAHEYGHFQSWDRSRGAGGVARREWEAYDDVAHRRDAIASRVLQEVCEQLPKEDRAAAFHERRREADQRELSQEDRDRIVAEESLAWRLGREALEQRGWQDFVDYDERAAGAVQIYRFRLGIVNLDAVPEHMRGG